MNRTYGSTIDEAVSSSYLMRILDTRLFCMDVKMIGVNLYRISNSTNYKQYYTAYTTSFPFMAYFHICKFSK